MTLTDLIADSAHAATFQTLGQYRMALLAAAKEHDARQEGIVRAVVLAYKEGKNGEAYHPGYTPHEAAAFEIGQRERAVIAGLGLPRGHTFRIPSLGTQKP